MVKKYTLYIVVAVCLIMSASSLYVNNNYRESVSENALSLISMILRETEYSENREELVKNLLTFTSLSNEYKDDMLMAVADNSAVIDDLVTLLEYFEYNSKNVRELENLLKEYRSTQVIKINSKITSEELADKLVREIYNGIVFEKLIGDGDDYLVRYLCSNICIDACNDGKLRYLCDITVKSSTDLFRNWLFEKEDAKITESDEKYGIIYESVSGENIDARLCINPENSRIFAAEITIKY